MHINTPMLKRFFEDFYLFARAHPCIRSQVEGRRERDKLSRQPNMGPDLTIHEIMTWAKLKSWMLNRLSHPDAPLCWCNFNTSSVAKLNLFIPVPCHWNNFYNPNQPVKCPMLVSWLDLEQVATAHYFQYPYHFSFLFLITYNFSF